MGYDIHITRSEHWVDHSKNIAEAEWRELVASDPELKLSGFTEVTSPVGEAIRFESRLVAEWSGHPNYDVLWFVYWDGLIVVKNPDDTTIDKMKQIARKLNARVRGDEDEFYD